MCVPAKWLQLCPTLCNLMDYSPPGCSVYGMLLARILEWVAISLSTWAANLVAKPRGWVGFRYDLIKAPPPTVRGSLLVLVSPSVSSTVRKAAPSFLEAGCSCSLPYILPSFNASAHTFPVSLMSPVSHSKSVKRPCLNCILPSGLWVELVLLESHELRVRVIGTQRTLSVDLGCWMLGDKEEPKYLPHHS